MLKDVNKYVVLLYWDKITWYAFGAISASLSQHNIPFEVIKGEVTKTIENWTSKGYRVIYGESSRNMTLSELKTRLKSLNDNFSSTEVISVIGGPHASGNPLEILKMGANFVVIGEGEVTFPELIHSLSKQHFSLHHPLTIPGIGYLDTNDDLVQTSARPRIDLNHYCPYSVHEPFPLHPPIEIMRGCAFRCRFCQVPYMYGNPKFRSIDAILKIIEHYYEYFHPLKKQVDIRFIAPNSLGYMEKKRGIPNIPILKELVQQIRQYDVRLFLGTFPSEVRPEYITEDIVSIFSSVDNTQISVGFQSGSDKILHDMRRGHTVDAGMRAYDLLTSQGYTPVFDFILGTPSETEQDQWDTLEVMRDLGRKARVRLHYFMPLPGTPWSSEKPVPLFPQVHSEIGRLAHDEILSGDFDRQYSFSKPE
ncbi:B12-binding domain/radical SAM domain-containing protein [Candidatus Heimdallarchaeota archaeon B3_Heim]|nr:MAG: B12-binding domain/radical SAM domain-containing protein [Candidatus Heimdallarchaeota archaeon B3_Heim]